MPDRDFTVLDLISTAGGIPVTMINPQVRVARGGKVYGVDFADLMQHPEMDAVLKPGDRIYVVPESRHFLSFGAASKEMMVPFPAAKVSALDAVALIGGLIDTEADAKGVLVLRDYPASAVRSDGKGPTHKRMIFAFNLLSADGLFSAGEFKIQDKDLVMVAQSPLLTETAVLNFVNALLNAGNSAVAFGLNQRKF
jgi:polysaccharide export outer membrane protein